MFQTASGTLCPLPCASPNLCSYCARRTAMENAAVVRLDAESGDFPRVGLCLTTVDPKTTPKQFGRDVDHAMRFLGSRLGEMRQLLVVEWTTGRAKTSGGHRRIHAHGLVKDVDPVEAGKVERDLRGWWKKRTGAHRVELRELRTAAGATAYLVQHHLKPEQAAPLNLKGVKRFRPGRGYFDRPLSELRQEARAVVDDARLQAALRHAVDYETWTDLGLVDEADARLTAALADARAERGEGGKLVRVQWVPDTWGEDDAPATWAVEVLGDYTGRADAA